MKGKIFWRARQRAFGCGVVEDRVALNFEDGHELDVDHSPKEERSRQRWMDCSHKYVCGVAVKEEGRTRYPKIEECPAFLRMEENSFGEPAED